MADDKKKEVQIPRGKDMATLTDAINKYLKADCGTMASTIANTTVDKTYLYPTGILSLDRYLGVGGMLGGRIMNAWGWEGCLAGNSEILDSDTGLKIKIQDIVNGSDSIFNVPATLCYEDMDDCTEIEPKNVIARYNSGEKECFRLSTTHGASIVATKDHPFLVVNKGWTDLSDIKAGDYIARPKCIDVNGHSKYDPMFARLVGYLLGDGCLTGDSVRMSIYDNDILKDITDIVGVLYPDLSVKKTAKEKGTYSISMNNSTKTGGNKLLNILKELDIFGHKNLDKYIPYDIIQANNQTIAELLSGLIMSDGHVSESKARVQFASTSIKLAQQVQFILLRLGIPSSILFTRKDTRKSSYLNLYTVTVGGVSNLQRLDNWVNLLGKKADRLERHVSKTPRMSMYDYHAGSLDMQYEPINIWWDKVESIIPVGSMPTYNLAVYGSESYIANDIIVHNCGKTLSALTIAATMQRQKFTPCPGNTEGEGRVAFLDAEGTYSPSMAAAVGVDPSKLMLFQSTPEKILTGEDYFDIMKILIQNGIEFIIVDSLPALVPSSRMNAVVGQGQKATSAVMIAEGLQQITPLMNGFKRSVLWLINQKRMKPMVMFGPTEGHTGGEAIKFFETYSLEVKKRGDIIKKVPNMSNQIEERRIGVTVEAKLHKNKTAAIPTEAVQYDIYFETVTDDQGVKYHAGVDVYKDVVQVGIDCNVITKVSSWFSYGDIKANGMEAFMDALRKADRSVIEKIRAEVLNTNK